MKIFISGGAKNGKSYYAQKRAKEMSDKLGVPLYYVATMIPKDDEDRARIKRHLEERDGWGFTTIERGRDISGILAEPEASPEAGQNPESAEPEAKREADAVYLIDSITALLANEMFPDGEINRDAGSVVAEDILRFLNKANNVVTVSDYIYGDPKINPTGPDDLTELYVRSLARVDRLVAEASDEVIEISAGIPIKHKG